MQDASGSLVILLNPNQMMAIVCPLVVMKCHVNQMQIAPKRIRTVKMAPAIKHAATIQPVSIRILAALEFALNAIVRKKTESLEGMESYALLTNKLN